MQYITSAQFVKDPKCIVMQWLDLCAPLEWSGETAHANMHIALRCVTVSTQVLHQLGANEPLMRYCAGSADSVMPISELPAACSVDFDEGLIRTELKSQQVGYCSSTHWQKIPGFVWSLSQLPQATRDHAVRSCRWRML